jgi:hypothetical protein
MSVSAREEGAKQQDIPRPINAARTSGIRPQAAAIRAISKSLMRKEYRFISAQEPADTVPP